MLKKCKYIPVLVTERLVLRELTENDVEDLRNMVWWDTVSHHGFGMSEYAQKQ